MSVTKKMAVSAILMLGTVMLMACGKDVSLEVLSTDGITSVPVMESTESQENEEIPITVSTTDMEVIKSEIVNCKMDISAYLSLLDIMGESGLGEDEVDSSEMDCASAKYSLIYFDEDDQPELVIGQDDYISIYSINADGVVITLVDSLYSVEPSYYERKGIVEQWSRWNGGGDEGSYASDFYVITEENPYTAEREPDFGYEYNAVYDDDGVWTETGVTDYLHNGNDISEEEYKQIFEQYQISEWSDDAEEKEEGRVGSSLLF